VVADVVPIIGDVLGAGAGLVGLLCAVVVGPAVIALAWLWYRPLVSIVVLAAGVAAGIGLHRLAVRRRAARVPVPAPTA
jgi:Transmembrane protein 43